MLKKLIRWLNAGVILLTLFSYLSPYIHPDITWIFAFLGTGYTWLLLINILFVLFWLILKKWYFVFSLICILIGWQHFTNFVGLNIADTVASKNTLTVMTYNVQGFYKLDAPTKKKKEKKQADFSKLLTQKIVPDVICTQETGWEDLITRNKEFAYSLRKERVFIFSRYPMIEKGHVELDGPVVGCVWADIQKEKKIIRVYSIHLSSSQVTTDADKLRKSLKDSGNLQDKETWQGVRSMMSKYSKAARRRAEQAEKIAKHIESSPYPVIVCGDFNETPLSYAYHHISQNLKDAYREKAFGLGTTFGGSIPGLRIDYTLVDSSLMIQSHKILKEVVYSDHYPVVTKISY